MLIQDITFKFPDGTTEVFQGVKERKIAITDSIAAFNMFSALDVPLGLVVCGPGTVVRYGNDQITTSQVEDNGFVRLPTAVEE